MLVGVGWHKAVLVALGTFVLGCSYPTSAESRVLVCFGASTVVIWGVKSLGNSPRKNICVCHCHCELS